MCVYYTHAVLWAGGFCVLAFTAEIPTGLWISLVYDVNK